MPWGSPLKRKQVPTSSNTGGPKMAKAAGKLDAKPKTDDAEQFQHFLEAARKRGMDENLEDFAARFAKIAPAKPKPKSL
jgi:hypothetical protein